MNLWCAESPIFMHLALQQQGSSFMDEKNWLAIYCPHTLELLIHQFISQAFHGVLIAKKAAPFSRPFEGRSINQSVWSGRGQVASRPLISMAHIIFAHHLTRPLTLSPPPLHERKRSTLFRKWIISRSHHSFDWHVNVPRHDGQVSWWWPKFPTFWIELTHMYSPSSGWLILFITCTVWLYRNKFHDDWLILFLDSWGTYMRIDGRRRRRRCHLLKLSTNEKKTRFMTYRCCRCCCCCLAVDGYSNHQNLPQHDLLYWMCPPFFYQLFPMWFTLEGGGEFEGHTFSALNPRVSKPAISPPRDTCQLHLINWPRLLGLASLIKPPFVWLSFWASVCRVFQCIFHSLPVPLFLEGISAWA